MNDNNYDREIYEKLIKPLIEDHMYLYEIQKDTSNGLSDQIKKMMQMGLKLYFTKLDHAIKLLIINGLWPEKGLCPEMISELQHDTSFFEGFGIEMKAPYEILGLTSVELNQIQNLYQEFLNQERIGDASCLALLLTSLDPNSMIAWIALGITEQLAGRFQEATLAFSTAIKNGSGSLLPLLYAAKGYVQLSQLELAREIVHKLLQVNTISEENTRIKEDAKRILPLIS